MTLPNLIVIGAPARFLKARPDALLSTMPHSLDSL